MVQLENNLSIRREAVLRSAEEIGFLEEVRKSSFWVSRREERVGCVEEAIVVGRQKVDGRLRRGGGCYGGRRCRGKHLVFFFFCY